MRRFSGIFISASRLENLPESIKHGNTILYTYKRMVCWFQDYWMGFHCLGSNSVIKPKTYNYKGRYFCQ